mgnify:CR=1 FL=1
MVKVTDSNGTRPGPREGLGWKRDPARGAPVTRPPQVGELWCDPVSGIVPRLRGLTRRVLRVDHVTDTAVYGFSGWQARHSRAGTWFDDPNVQGRATGINRDTFERRFEPTDNV